MTCKLVMTWGMLLVALGTVTGCGGPVPMATQDGLQREDVAMSDILSAVRAAPTVAPGENIATAGIEIRLRGCCISVRPVLPSKVSKNWP